MCGICGIWNYAQGEPVDRDALDRMNSAMFHRGPDEGGLLCDGAFGMAMRRLSIIDVGGGSQPIFSEDKRHSVVFNGEIYNFASLRQRLAGSGHQFGTRSDTEVIVHGYEEWGPDIASRLNGMFGFAVWDASERQLLLARDHYGVKPLYWCDDGSRLLFASEIRPLLAAGHAPQVDPHALEWFLRYRYTPSPRTMFEGIRRLPAGHLLTCGSGGPPHVAAFAGPVPTREATPAEATTRLHELLADAVRRQMVADVPVGLMLSGGVDSALIGHLMAHNSDEPIRTYSVGFVDDPGGDELAAAASTARDIGSVHSELRIRADEYLDFLPRSVWLLEEPVATPSTLALWRLSEFARQDVKVALTGQGADEPFGGYARYPFERAMERTRWMAPVRDAVVRAASAALPANEKLYRARLSLGVWGGCERVDRVNRVIDDADFSGLTGGAFASSNSASPFEQWCAGAPRNDAVSLLQYVDARTMLPDNLLLYGDKTSMAVSLELRVPYLDRVVAEYVEGLPPSLKIRHGVRKWLLRQVAQQHVSRETLVRPKANFSVPVDHWLRGDLGGRLEALMRSESSLTRGWLDEGAALRMLWEHRVGQRDRSHILFALLTLELWHASYIVAEGARGALTWDAVTP